METDTGFSLSLANGTCMKYRFITLEGGESTGKSTVAKQVVQTLKEKGIPVVLTREPGGSKGAEVIRELLMCGQVDRWDAMTEVFLVLAARRDHWIHTIEPAITAGKLVICDRFYDSTRVYQGIGGGVDIEFIDLLHQKALPQARPDRTYIFDLDPQIGLARMPHKEQTETWFELKDLSYHQKIRTAYQQIAKQEPHRCCLIDANQSIETVQALILKDLGVL